MSVKTTSFFLRFVHIYVYLHLKVDLICFTEKSASEMQALEDVDEEEYESWPPDMQREYDERCRARHLQHLQR